MSRALYVAAALAGLCLASSFLAACASSKTVVEIDGAPDASISEATLDHWMQSMAGADFRDSIGTQGPRGLVSEPADYPRCIVAAKLVAPRSFFNQLKLSKAYLAERCHELHRSIKAQALSFLISTKWALVEGAERGIHVTDAEVKQAFTKLRTRAYPTESALHAYLDERQWSLSDLLYQIKRTILAGKLEPRQAAGFADVAVQQTYALEQPTGPQKGLLARTKCAPSDIVPNCSAYDSSVTASQAPAFIFLHLVRKDL
jgi:hypothetical protein